MPLMSEAAFRDAYNDKPDNGLRNQKLDIATAPYSQSQASSDLYTSAKVNLTIQAPRAQKR